MEHTPSNDLIIWEFDFALTTFFEVETDLFQKYFPSAINPMEVSPGIGLGNLTAFNFPVAVWSWNVALAWVCGNVCVWKPSEKTPLCSLACQKIINEVVQYNYNYREYYRYRK